MTDQLRAFSLADSATVRTLIQEGLKQRFGFLLEDANPDIDDFQAHYLDKGATVLVLEQNGQIIGCGALIKENGSDTVARIVRVSVDASQQGRGYGHLISRRLIDTAIERGFTRIEVETNDDWDSALRLYKSLGFIEYKRVHVPEYDFTEVHMAMEL
jgi:ribosomal protein S18 acetylase RimI-like enzyme